MIGADTEFTKERFPLPVTRAGRLLCDDEQSTVRGNMGIGSEVMVYIACEDLGVPVVRRFTSEERRDSEANKATR